MENYTNNMNIKKRNSKRNENQQAMYTHLKDFHYCSFCIAWTNDNLAPKTRGMTKLSSNLWIMVFHNKSPRETFEEWSQMKATWSMPCTLLIDICSLKVSRKIRLYWELIITLLGSSSMINLWSSIKRWNLDPNFKYTMLKSLR